MAKDPAFLFYSNDFLSGTMFFSDEQVGKYIRLLIAQHQHGHLSEKHMLHICKTYDADIFAKFVQDEQGLYYNEKLEIESTKRKNFSESRKANRKGKKDDICTTHEKHMSPHMEIVNENINENEIELKETDISQTIEFLKITANRTFTPQSVRDYFKAFCIQTEKEYYHTRAKKLSHFRNWLKLQPHETTKRTASQDHAKPGSVRTAI